MRPLPNTLINTLGLRECSQCVNLATVVPDQYHILVYIITPIVNYIETTVFFQESDRLRVRGICVIGR